MAFLVRRSGDRKDAGAKEAVKRLKRAIVEAQGRPRPDLVGQRRSVARLSSLKIMLEFM